jgi:hypothetical protein
MDTYNIIKQLTAKSDMVSGESLKDNFKALLPIRDVHKGWGIYAGQWYFNFAPHEDYPHKEPYKLETDVFNENERVGDVEAINKDVDKYNDWADEKNEIHRKEVFEKTIPDLKARDVKELNIKSREYFPLPHLSAWVNGFVFDQPEFRLMEHAINFGYVDDRELYKLKERLEVELFVKKFNKQLFNYIRANVKMAEKYNTWSEDNLWFEPNREFVHWFQIRGINPDDVASFDNDIIDLTYDEECEEAFDYKDFNKTNGNDSYVVIEQKMRKVIKDNKYLFQDKGKTNLTRGYEIGVRYWTKGGTPIKVKQMIDASTKYLKRKEDLV